jgi:hypothetical protein
MQILVLIGSSVSEVGQVKVCHFPFKRYMAYNNLHSTTVHAVMWLIFPVQSLQPNGLITAQLFNKFSM